MANIVKSKATAEIGTTGLNRFGGTIVEEFLTELRGQRGLKIYDEMRKNDAIVGGILFAIEMALREVNWSAEATQDDAKAKEATKFVTSCMRDMSHTWSDFICEALLMLPFGFSWFEIVYKQRDGKNSKYSDNMIGWRKFGYRSPDSLYDWEFDDAGGVTAFMQQSPPSYSIVRIPIEKSILFRTRKEKNNPEGYSILRNSYRCYSEDTEALTSDGWKLVSDITMDDDVATLNPITNTLEFQRPIETFAYDYSGKMFHQSGRYIDLLVTPNHNMWVKLPGRKIQAFEFVEAQKLPRHVLYKRDCKWEGKEANEFILPSITHGNGFIRTVKSLNMDDWLAFLGIYLSEGSCYRKKGGTKQASVTITQNQGPKLDKMKKVISNLGYNYWERKDGIRSDLVISDLQLYEYLHPLGHAHNKYIPTEFKQLSSRQLNILLDSLIMGDGTFLPCGTRLYYTVSNKLADDVSELMLKTGKCPNKRPLSRKTSMGKGNCWVIAETNSREKGGNWVNLIKNQQKYIDYKGDVYCIEVPNHIIYVRRNGKSCWCGNSYYFKKNLEALEGISLERVYAGFPVVKLPKGASTGGSSNSDESKAKDLVRKVRVDEQMGIVLPDGWEFKLLGPEGGRGIDAFDRSIMRYRQEIMITVLATFIALGIDKTGSYALARETRDFFQIALSGWLNNIAETLNQFAIPKLLQLNDYDQWLVQLVPGKVGQFDLDKLSNYISRLAMVGAIQIDESLERFLREAGNLPPKVQSEVRPPIIPGATGIAPTPAGEVEKAEGWHPSLAKKPGLIRNLKEVEGELEAETRKFFRLQAEWIDRHWEDFLPTSKGGSQPKSKSEVLKKTPKDWEAWIPEFVKWILPSLGKAMVLGADSARSDLPGITVDWSLQNPKALEFIRQHGLKLAKTINETTQERLRETLRTGMELGENKAALVQRVKDVMIDATDFRAKLIAQTETMTAYNEGALELYKEGGVKKKEWMDGQDGACPVCSNLDGTTIDIDDDFDAQQFGMVANPPSHPGCRCSLRGVVEIGKAEPQNPRKYEAVVDYFHNYEHDPQGLTHCKGSDANPYEIKHFEDKHIISLAYARGHGENNTPQWFHFPKKLRDGFELESGKKINVPDKTNWEVVE